MLGTHIKQVLAALEADPAIAHARRVPQVVVQIRRRVRAARVIRAVGKGQENPPKRAVSSFSRTLLNHGSALIELRYTMTCASALAACVASACESSMALWHCSAKKKIEIEKN